MTEPHVVLLIERANTVVVTSKELPDASRAAKYARKRVNDSDPHLMVMALVFSGSLKAYNADYLGKCKCKCKLCCWIDEQGRYKERALV